MDRRRVLKTAVVGAATIVSGCTQISGALTDSSKPDGSRWFTSDSKFHQMSSDLSVTGTRCMSSSYPDSDAIGEANSASISVDGPEILISGSISDGMLDRVVEISDIYEESSGITVSLITVESGESLASDCPVKIQYMLELEFVNQLPEQISIKHNNKLITTTPNI